MAVFHPVQISDLGRRPQLPVEVTMAAYEVYSHIHGPQPAMVDLEGRNCRGGFSVGEIIAYLYARSFSRDQWEARAEEAFKRAPDDR
jgi:hypothetical protein